MVSPQAVNYITRPFLRKIPESSQQRVSTKANPTIQIAKKDKPLLPFEAFFGTTVQMVEMAFSRLTDG